MGFDSKTEQEIKFYVYALVDPRDDQPFYIGKGTGTRVFAHVQEATSGIRDTDKLNRIREIEESGEQVRMVIVRHGLSKNESLLVESCFLDFFRYYDMGLTNIAGGHHATAFGMMTTNEIATKFNAPPLESIGDDCVLLNINKNYKNARRVGGGIYEATRRSWVIDEKHLGRLKYALAEYRGFVVGVFRIGQWENGDDPRRKEFVGREAEDAVKEIYMNKRVPKTRGQANPVRYRL